MGVVVLIDPRVRLILGTELADHNQRVLSALDSVRVVLRVQGAPPAAAASVGLLVSLTARLFAHVEIDGDAHARVSGVTMSATELLDRLRWLRPAPATTATTDKVIGIGIDTGGAVDLGVGGDVWTCRLVRGRSAQVCTNVNSPLFGAQAAACLAVAELVKDILMPLGFTARPLAEALSWDLSSYSLCDSGRPTGSGRRICVPVALAGVGSVGTSVVSALLSGPEPFVSSVDLIDPESFDDRNPYRYPALVDNVEGIEKANWAHDALVRGGIPAEPFPVDLAGWVSRRAEPGFSGALVASPDTLDGRLDVADVLARETLSVGVAGLAFHVSRHHPGDGLACPYCEYVDTAPAAGQSEVFAVHTGLDARRIQQLMQPGATLTATDLAVCVTAGKIRSDTALRLAGHHLDDLVARAYAEVVLPAPSPTAAEAGQVLLAAPYVSALAGVLAAAELYKGYLGLAKVDRRVDIDLTGLPQGFVRRPAADDSSRCLCASPFRRRAAATLYLEAK